MRTRTAVLAALTLLALTACSSEASNPPADAAPKSGAAAQTDKPAAADDGRADLEAAVRAYSTAYFATDVDTAYGMLSTRCAANVDRAWYQGAVEQTVKTMGKHEIKTLTVDTIAGDLARVSYTYDVPKLSQAQQPWAREGGVWKYDAC